MATKAQVINRAGNDLGLLRLNQSLQAQDNTRITSAYSEVYAQLKKDGLASWTSTGDVPDELVPHVVALICENCMGTYSVSPERAQRILLAFSKAMPGIHRYQPGYVSQDEPTDY